MPKGFILVDDIPCNCWECCSHNYHFCSWTVDRLKEYMNNNIRPDSCPIKKIPDKYPERDYAPIETKQYMEGYEDGYNSCVNNIIRQ